MKRFRIALGIALIALTGPTLAQQLKIATLAPDGSSWMTALQSAGDIVETDTGGRVQIRFYPGGVMGDATAIMRRMRLGQLHGGAFTLGDLVAVSPVVNMYSLPFVFRNAEEVAGLRDQFDPLILAELEQGGLVVPGIALGGFAYLFAREPFPAPEAMSTAWRVWVQPGDELSRETLEQVGVSPVPLPLADVYTALQTGAINTFASTPSGAIILQWHTRARHMLDLPVLMTGGTIGFNSASLNRLQPADREILLDRFANALAELERNNFRENTQAREALVEQGVQVSVPSNEQMESWRAAARATLARMRETGRIEIPHFDEMMQALEAARETR